MALLTGASVLLATVLYCFQEYLVFTVYAAAFPEADALARFLAPLYAGLQLVEFVLLYALGRPLITRSGPVLRNTIFPLTTLASLGWLGLNFQLPAAVLSHANSDAAYNAIYEPVRTLNLVALPLRILGRVRTVADAMIYPAGIALGGLLLLVLQAHLTLHGIALAALLCASALLAVGIALGHSFLPTLIRSLRAGAVSIADVAAGMRALPASAAADVRHMLASADAEERVLGLALARRIDPGAVLEPVCALAAGADAATRCAVAAVLMRLPAADAAPAVGRLLASDDCAQQILALAGCAGARSPRRSGPACQALRFRGAPVALLGLLAGGRPEASGRSDRRSRSRRAPDRDGRAWPPSRSSATLVVAVLRACPPALRASGLEALAALPGTPDGSVTALAEDLGADKDPAVRAAALRLSALGRGTGARASRRARSRTRTKGSAGPRRERSPRRRRGPRCPRDTAIDAPEPRWEAIVWALTRMRSRPAQSCCARRSPRPSSARPTHDAALLRALPRRAIRRAGARSTWRSPTATSASSSVC